MRLFAVGCWVLQVLEHTDKPLMFRLHQLGAADCHFAYRMVVVMMRRDMPISKVCLWWEACGGCRQLQASECQAFPHYAARISPPSSCKWFV